jgi:AcrR family transcriptional regulator
VARQIQEANTAPPEADKRQERAHRILDAAAALILRWGYNKTTIDDIARQAGVAKGTIYLHWKTREELFAALMRREKLALGETIRQAIAADPAGGTLGGMLKHSARALLARPLMKAVLLRDMDVLGKLAQTEHQSALYAEQLAGFTAYLELLREQGLVRTDLSLRAQVYVLSAVFTGFFLAAPLMPHGFLVADEELVDLLAETIHRTLEPDRTPAAAGLETASNILLDYLNRSMITAQEQLQEEVK